MERWSQYKSWEASTSIAIQCLFRSSSATVFRFTKTHDQEAFLRLLFSLSFRRFDQERFNIVTTPIAFPTTLKTRSDLDVDPQVHAADDVVVHLRLALDGTDGSGGLLAETADSRS